MLTPNYCKNNYLITFDDIWALGPYCETSFPPHILHFRLEPQTFSMYLYLVFCHNFDRFSIEIRFTCAHCFIQSKSRSNQRFNIADWPWNLNLASFYFYLLQWSSSYFQKSWQLLNTILVTSPFSLCYFWHQ